VNVAITAMVHNKPTIATGTSHRPKLK